MANKPGGDDDVYEIQEVAAEIPHEWVGRSNAAMYDLESPAKCPYCREALKSLRVLRLARAQVSFTSTLPRSGRAIVCPSCERILSVELSGLL